MNNMTVKKCVLIALVAVGATIVMSEDSQAFFGRRGSHGSCGSSGGSWGSGGSSGSWGSNGSHGGWRHRRGSWGSNGSSGSWGSNGSHGGYGGSHGSNGGYYSSTTYGSGSYVVVRESKPVTIAATAAVKTRLTLRVPAEAKVTLAGVETKQTGEVRSFSTNRLTAGQVWDDYTVVVEVERNGQVLREERTIKLTGGTPQELAVDFADNQLAQR
jgi:uncharacterized protein (TIGR03000 family)